jgi:hypothetical protein
MNQVNSLCQKYFDKLAQKTLWTIFSIWLSKFYAIFHLPQPIFTRLGLWASGFGTNCGQWNNILQMIQKVCCKYMYTQHSDFYGNLSMLSKCKSVI